jgi:acyl-CoA thioester hydrolase
MQYRFLHDTPLRWKDIDSEGVLNHAVYLTLAEQARYAYFQELGFLRDGRVPFLLGEAAARYEKPGLLRHRVLTIAVRTVRLGGKSFDMDYEVRAGNERLATIAQTLIWVDEALKSMEIPPGVRAKIAAFEQIAERASRAS